MTTTRINTVPVGASVTLDEVDLLRHAVEAVTGGFLAIVEPIAEEVAAKARDDWYSPEGVTEESGRSGDIQAVTTISAEEVRVGVYSDAPYARYVRRARFIRRKVSNQEWGRWAQRGLPVGPMPFIRVANPAFKPAGSNYLLPEMISAPFRAKVKEAVPAIGQAIGTAIAARLGK